MGIVFASLMISVVIPLYMIWWLTNARTVNRSQLAVKTVASAIVLLALFGFNYWAAVSLHLRYIWLILWVAAAAVAWKNASAQPWNSRLTMRQWAPVAGGATLILLFGLLLVQVRLAGHPPEGAVELDFPFAEGHFVMGQAGGTQALNGHLAVRDVEAYRGQSWALDILQIDAAGRRARGIYPAGRERYHIFGTAVHAPCDASVAGARDDLPDQDPPQTDRENLPGNYLLLECEEGFFVLLAHLQQGSLRVGESDRVRLGDRLANVGNSGNTSEPHLHIHAQAGSGGESLLAADPLPILFRGHGWLVRNDRVRAGR